MTLDLANMSYRYDTKAQSRKDRIGKLDFIRMKNLLCERHCSENEETNADGQKLFAYHLSNKRLLNRTKNSQNSTRRKETTE